MIAQEAFGLSEPAHIDIRFMIMIVVDDSDGHHLLVSDQFIDLTL